MGSSSSSPTVNGSDDVVRLVFSGVFLIIGTLMMFFCLAMYRHNQRNKKANYRRRYQSYINTLGVTSFAAWIVGIGKLLPSIDMLETTKRELGGGGGERVSVQYGWWIFYALYTSLIILTLCAHHRLTIYGIILSGIMGLASSTFVVLLSLSASYQGWIVWSVLFAFSIAFAHFFIWWKSKRDYNKTKKLQTISSYGEGFLSYAIVDAIALFFSSLFFILALTFLILGNEITQVISELVTEIANGIVVLLHWSIISFITFFWFMDIPAPREDSEVYSEVEKKRRSFNWKKDKRGPENVHKNYNPFEKL